MRLIKRYKNRRLYDTELRKSITFMDVKSYIMDGIEVKIIDNTSGDDITVSVLSSIMGGASGYFEDSGIKIIDAIIKREGAKAMDVVKKITLASIGAVNLTREKAEEMFDELVKKGEDTNDEQAKAVKDFVDKRAEAKEKVIDWMEDTYNKIAEKFSTKVNEQIGELSLRLEQMNNRLSEIEKKINTH